MSIRNLSAVDYLAGQAQQYGLAFVMVASYFGSGSIFIASQAGVIHGYTLLWAVVGAALLGFMAQDMSARLGIHGTSLMVFVREKVGRPAAMAIALFLSIGCVAWTIGLVAAVGAGFSFLVGGAIGWQPIAVVATLAAIGVGLLNYDTVETLMIAMMLSLMVMYVIVAVPSGADLNAVALGFIPTTETFGALPMAAGLLGTTALWPNFFLESILVHEKGWTDQSDLPGARADLAIGYAVGGLTTLAILITAAALLRPMGFTQLDTFITPGKALVEVLGVWAMVLFVIGVIVAAFNSIIPIMWTPAYMIPQAAGYEVNKGDRRFTIVFVTLTGIGVFSPVFSRVLDLSVIDMAILFPTVNGIFGLPVAATLLFWAVNDRETMGEYRNSRWLNVVNASLVVLAITLGALAMQGFLDLFTGGGF
ncbi:divalent metal cation transporter [Natrinema thermotolerans]|uniref:Divalent metal cation transporter n=1 Tax=Natrinema thermotolerans TaxID=121872 RepID=A0AAF0SZ14_9EURY|nr:divalent metal cation transporter [Natrinema thermotolerans]QCC60654.1 iron transporter [Natrinema thermotolerans]QCC61540.1 iron transporter [Natrinema thermotolerans]WMT07696.1 divalent metal cation transporter [Natrinema thermotolerans]WMT08328.1 divalent metal cation transporter [Natrinema thermotolerans]